MNKSAMNGQMTKEGKRAALLEVWLDPDVLRVLAAWIAHTKPVASEEIRRSPHLAERSFTVALVGGDKPPGSGGSRYRGGEA